MAVRRMPLPLVLCVTTALAACGPERRDAPPDAGSPEPPVAEQADEDALERAGTAERAAELPGEVADAASPPPAELFLPALEGYDTDDDVDAGEVAASLDHGEVSYRDVRRRLILDEQGFTSGMVTIVVLEPGAGGGERYLTHRYGEVRRAPIRVAGVDMLRVAAEPHDAIAWIGPAFAVTFERGQERSDAWLEELARAKVAAIAAARR